MEHTKKIARSTAFLFISEIISKIFSFLLVVLISRYFGDVGFGKYSFIFAFAGLFVVFAYFGLAIYTFREISKDKAKTQRLVGNVISLKIVLMVFAYLVATIIATQTPKAQFLLIPLLLVMIHELFGGINIIIGMIFKANERNEFIIYSVTSERGLALLFGGLSLIMGYGLSGLLFALVIAKILSFGAHYFMSYKYFVKIRLYFELSYWKKLLKWSAPFLLTQVFITLYFQVDKVMITWIKGYAVTGWYNAAATLINALLFIPLIIVTAVFPAMSRLHHINSKDKLHSLYKKTFYYLLISVVPICIGISMLSERIILFIYTEQFILSAMALRILVFSLLFWFLNYFMGYLLNSINKQHLFTISGAVLAITNIVLNFILIPVLSHVGAALATVLTQAINFGVLLFFTGKNGYLVNPLKLVYKPFIAGLVMIVVIYYLSSVHLVLLVPLAAISYIAILFAIKGIGKEEIALVKSIKI